MAAAPVTTPSAAFSTTAIQTTTAAAQGSTHAAHDSGGRGRQLRVDLRCTTARQRCRYGEDKLHLLLACNSADGRRGSGDGDMQTAAAVFQHPLAHASPLSRDGKVTRR
ncbi:hypothetical protein AAHE18_13G213500 [Arachis hypogaea]